MIAFDRRLPGLEKIADQSDRADNGTQNNRCLDGGGLPLGSEEKRRELGSDARHAEKEREGQETHEPRHGQQVGSGARGSQLGLGKCGEGDRVYQSRELVDGERGEIICHGIVSEQDVSEELAPDEFLVALELSVLPLLADLD